MEAGKDNGVSEDKERSRQRRPMLGLRKREKKVETEEGEGTDSSRVDS
jgi:hypothetical protein